MAMNDYTSSELMIAASARALEGERVVFVGVGMPNIACNLARRTVAPDLELVYESGVFGARPARLPLSIGDPTLVSGATSVCSMSDLFMNYLQGGRIEVACLGAAGTWMDDPEGAAAWGSRAGGRIWSSPTRPTLSLTRRAERWCCTPCTPE